MKFLKYLCATCAIGMMFILTSCETEELAEEYQGQMTVKVTDAPIDKTEVSGVFVTIAGIKVDGDLTADFEGAQTIDLLSLQQGRTKTVGTFNLDAKTYQEITLILDLQADAAGNAPGCYVLMNDGSKVDLNGTADIRKEIVIQKQIDLNAQSNTTLVIDFDLRKAITDTKEGAIDGAKDAYTFVTENELVQALRAEIEESAGMIEGKIDHEMDGEIAGMLVFAYEDGQYNADIELEGQGASKIQFKNAVASAKVEQNGEFTLAFLPEGNYELHAVGIDQDGNIVILDKDVKNNDGDANGGGASADGSADGSANATLLDDGVRVNVNSSANLNVKLF